MLALCIYLLSFLAVCVKSYSCNIFGDYQPVRKNRVFRFTGRIYHNNIVTRQDEPYPFIWKSKLIMDIIYSCIERCLVIFDGFSGIHRDSRREDIRLFPVLITMNKSVVVSLIVPSRSKCSTSFSLLLSFITGYERFHPSLYSCTVFIFAEDLIRINE